MGNQLPSRCMTACNPTCCATCLQVDHVRDNDDGKQGSVYALSRSTHTMAAEEISLDDHLEKELANEVEFWRMEKSNAGWMQTYGADNPNGLSGLSSLQTTQRDQDGLPFSNALRRPSHGIDRQVVEEAKVEVPSPDRLVGARLDELQRENAATKLKDDSAAWNQASLGVESTSCSSSDNAGGYKHVQYAAGFAVEEGATARTSSSSAQVHVDEAVRCTCGHVYMASAGSCPECGQAQHWPSAKKLSEEDGKRAPVLPMSPRLNSAATADATADAAADKAAAAGATADVESGSVIADTTSPPEENDASAPAVDEEQLSSDESTFAGFLEDQDDESPDHISAEAPHRPSRKPVESIAEDGEGAPDREGVRPDRSDF